MKKKKWVRSLNHHNSKDDPAQIKKKLVGKLITFLAFPFPTATLYQVAKDD